MRVDTQVHVVSRDQVRYPLDPPAMDVPRWFELYGRTVEALLGEMDAVGVDRAVLVQGFSAYQYDNRYTADSAATCPDRLACACIIDINADPLEGVRYWVGERRARAIRFFLQLDSDADWLDSRACDDVFAELQRHGAIAQAALVAEQLPALQRAAKRHLAWPFLLDHCGFSDFSGDSDFPNARALFALAAQPNVHVKVSNHVWHLAASSGAQPRSVTRALVDAFGGSRIMWASDLTVHDRSYADLIDEAEAACADLTAAQRTLVLGDAAAALWWSPH
ncbi:MAG: amidohydrolase family protein [Acidimicrobiales bacterium]